jgi:hypothetical protein
MYEVRSKTELTAEIKDCVSVAEDTVRVTAAVAVAGEKPLPAAIVGVHGISPIQQYAFQDQLATGMLSYLNAMEELKGTKRTWLSAPYWPRVAKSDKDPILKPSALRLYRDDETSPDDPTTQVYDVYEGYWSPFSKGKTNIASLLRWLLTLTFLATSSTARVPATGRKLAWDVGYVLAALGIAVVCLAGAFVAGSFAWSEFVAVFFHDPDPTKSPPHFWEFAFNPLQQVQHIDWFAWFQLAVNVALAYLVVQLVVVLRTRAKTRERTIELSKDARRNGHFDRQTIGAGAFHRWTTIGLVVFIIVLIGLDVWALETHYPAAAFRIAIQGAWLVVAVALLQGARGLADFVVLNVLGDVQVYTTHDCNSAFFAIRQQIIEAVTKAVVGPVNAVDITRTDRHGNPAQLYGKIHVAGHSLGSTVVLDALIRVRQLVNEKAIADDGWGSIRSLTTFGTALEKTRFFFDARTPTVSAAQQQWQNDVYGRFFTLQRRTLRERDNAKGIYWSNHWYFRDVVATRIVSYRSDVHPGEEFHAWSTKPPRPSHPICRNFRLPNTKPKYAFVHGDYLSDPLFWRNVGPIFTS